MFSLIQENLNNKMKSNFTLLALTGLLMLTCNACKLKIPEEHRDHFLSIPIDISSHRPVLQLTINNKGPYHFIFDTGSGGNIIDTELAKELGLNATSQDTLRTPGSRNFLLSDKVVAAIVSVAGIYVSNDVMFSTMTLRKLLPVDGIISQDFFSKYLVTIDYQNSRIMIDNGELHPHDKGVLSLIKSDIINFNISVNNKDVEAHLDSGNPEWIVLPYSYRNELQFESEPEEDGSINTPVASFKKWKATLKGTIRIGDVQYKNPVIELAEGMTVANIGFRFMNEVLISIDNKNKLIRFEKAVVINNMADPNNTQRATNDYTGTYGERKIFLDQGKLMLQRGGSAKLELVAIKPDLYKMIFTMPVMNELPNVRFERDSSGKVTGFTFLYKDGREEFIKKE